MSMVAVHTLNQFVTSIAHTTWLRLLKKEGVRFRTLFNNAGVL